MSPWETPPLGSPPDSQPHPGQHPGKASVGKKQLIPDQNLQVLLCVGVQPAPRGIRHGNWHVCIRVTSDEHVLGAATRQTAVKSPSTRREPGTSILRQPPGVDCAEPPVGASRLWCVPSPGWAPEQCVGATSQREASGQKPR